MKNKPSNFLMNDQYNIDDFIKKLSEKNDVNSWCKEFIDLSNIIEYDITDKEFYVIELFEKIKLIKDERLLTYCIACCAPLRRFALDEYVLLKQFLLDL